MKITLAEERDGIQVSENSYDAEIIKIGRNVAECQIVFANDAFPMVSRVHAELRGRGNEWFLFDANSTFGTFVNGLQITQPKAVAVGDRLQFGGNGPILKVIDFEVEQSLPRENNSPRAEKFQSQPTPPIAQSASDKWSEFAQSAEKLSNQPPIPTKLDKNKSSAAEIPALEFLDSENTSAPFHLTKSGIWLGRDPHGDIVFESTKIMVSRRHAEIRAENGAYVLYDNDSFNGTLINEQRISNPTPLYHDDEIRLGMGGPLLRFKSLSRLAPKGASLAGQRSVAASQIAETPPVEPPVGSKTMVFKVDNISAKPASMTDAQPQLLMSLTFGNKKELIIGRGDRSDVKLDGLQISNRHAKLSLTNSGILVEDLNSTNGIYLNGNRISRQNVRIEDAIQVGSFIIKIDHANNIGVFDTRSKTRIDAVNITKDVKNRAGGGTLRLLDNVSLSIQPNEFIGLLGPSGAGKSTLMDALNGMRPATGGSVLINNLDLYQHLNSLKQSIGYVPQDEIIHRELTVYRTLYYIAKLRLSRDVSAREIDQIIDEVLEVTGLTERRDVPIRQLSGGQRKRVSIAVELITKPSVIFLDEPTSGLDPATEEKIMTLFRQIAESGRTVILTTHAMENVKLFDKIVVLMRGKLVFYGTPDEVLKHLGATSFKDLYDKLEEPIEEQIAASGGTRQQITERVAEEWKQKFSQTPQYQSNVYEPLKELGTLQSNGVQNKNKLGVVGAIGQWWTLSKRYAQVLLRDKLTLFILFAQAPVIAVLIFFVMGANQPRDFIYFMISLIAVWFGTSVSSREIIRERAIYKRERMVNLGLLPYVFSKLFVLGIIVGIQCLLLFVPLKFFDLVGLMPMPGIFGGIPQFWIMLLTAAVGIALGLLISALVKTSEMATSLVPLILIPQILFSGLVGVPQGINKAAGLLMPATWSFDAMKRFSTLDTLEKEGALANGATDGRGLYKFIEMENDKIIADAKDELDEYKKDSEEKLKNFEDDLKSGKNPSIPKLDDPPKIADAKKIPEDLSGYITFLHPWMQEVLNQIVLMLMFGVLIIATLIILRLQDTR